MMGKSSWWSLAPSDTNRSNTGSMTFSGSTPGRSILLITTRGDRPISKAFWVTNRVWGIGPS
jgi:hypothetical protein